MVNFLVCGFSLVFLTQKLSHQISLLNPELNIFPSVFLYIVILYFFVYSIKNEEFQIIQPHEGKGQFVQMLTNEVQLSCGLDLNDGFQALVNRLLKMLCKKVLLGGMFKDRSADLPMLTYFEFLFDLFEYLEHSFHFCSSIQQS